MLDVIEGRWEDILSRGDELAGKQVRVEILPHPRNGSGRVPARYTRTLEALSELRSLKVSDAELAVLDGFEQFQNDHPFTIAQVMDLE